MNRFPSVRRLAPRALGAISGQLSQALASFVLQVAAARIMGAAGLGLFAVLYGAIVLGTAVSTGMVGDSLTVLDRSVPRIRTASVRWCLIISAAAGLVATTFVVAAGIVSPLAGVLYGLATFTFIAEDALRRLLMATMRFWSLPAVDGTSLAASLFVLVLARLLGAHISIATFFLAVFVGQCAASVVAIARLPRAERRFPVRGDAAMREVFDYGAWRSLQQCVRPLTLTAARVAITLVAGVAAYGRLEVARVYMAPALLIVSGLGSYLLPMYVSQRHESMRTALRRADRAAIALLASTLVVGAVGTLAAPVFGGIVTGGHYPLPLVVVLGWAVYAATGATLLPYGGLVAVRGRQRTLTALRALEPTVSVLLVTIAAATALSSAPYAIGAGSLVVAFTVRRRMLRPLIAADSEARAMSLSGASTQCA